MDDLSEVSHVLLLVVVGQLVEDLISLLGLEISVVLEPLTADSSGELHVLLHDRDSVGMDGAEVGVLEESDKVHLSSFLDGEQSLGLESELSVDALTDGSHKALEGSLEEKQVSTLLVPLDLSESDSAWLEASVVGSLDSAFCRGSLLLGNLGGLGSLGAGGNTGLGSSSLEFLSDDLLSGHS